jgi:hypothetical protein
MRPSDSGHDQPLHSMWEPEILSLPSLSGKAFFPFLFLPCIAFLGVLIDDRPCNPPKCNMSSLESNNNKVVFMIIIDAWSSDTWSTIGGNASR